MNKKDLAHHFIKLQAKVKAKIIELFLSWNKGTNKLLQKMNIHVAIRYVNTKGDVAGEIFLMPRFAITNKHVIITTFQLRTSFIKSTKNISDGINNEVRYMKSPKVKSGDPTQVS